MQREDYMRRAMDLALEAMSEREVPVGCVIADKDGKIIGTGRNRREANSDATAHAEMEAISQACAATGSWRLDGCTIYVTLEPCPMCAGAIINARIPQVVFAAREENTGACGSVLDLFAERFSHRPRVYCGVLEDESRNLLQRFFAQTRRED